MLRPDGEEISAVEPSVRKAMAFRERTGGLDLRKLERASATEAAALVQERDSDQFAARGGRRGPVQRRGARREWRPGALQPRLRAGGLERGIPNTLQTRFRVGSMNKMFTGVAVLQLAEAGRVELTAPSASTSPTTATGASPPRSPAIIC
jgi:CubicO group peptidase (beta-lactamase class C family)